MWIRVEATSVGTLHVWASGCRATQSDFFNQRLGFDWEQRVNGVIANTDTEPIMITTHIPATQNEAFMWSELLCGVRGRGTRNGLCQG